MCTPGSLEYTGELTEKEIIRAERNSGVVSNRVREIQMQNYLRKKEQKQQREKDLREGLRLYKTGKYEEALEKFESVLGSKSESNEASVASYNVACCYSKLNQIKAGLSALEDAMKEGFEDFKELQELHSSLEEAKADIVGLWALRFLISKDLLPKSLLKSMYVSFLAGCFRSVRFGLEEAHGKGQAVQFNWLFEKEAFILHHDETFSIDFDKVEGAVESLSREILAIQAKGDKEAAKLLLQKYATMSEPLTIALKNLEKSEVPVDITPTFAIASKIAH